MRIRVLYFAVVRERLGRGEDTIEVPVGTTAGALLDELERRHDAIAGLRQYLQVARNQSLVQPGVVLSDGDEVALIPPVSGGSGRPVLVGVRDSALSLDEVVRAVAHGGAGGIATFTGMVRGHSHGKRVVRLEYEAYAPMAEATLREIAEALEATHGARVAILHRVGVLSVGEVAVVIAASAPHRAESFAACREAIERLKRDVPIWKKEVGEDGEVWVGMGP
jgi:molybdopterin synthase catalytic subunit